MCRELRVETDQVWRRPVAGVEGVNAFMSGVTLPKSIPLIWCGEAGQFDLDRLSRQICDRVCSHCTIYTTYTE